ncbi:MAG: endonuclease III domain-containing protein [Proteobacteria bacterium]|nr:endonuclease III domain-containing protein [Pseudomonadota bacterium]
MKKQIFMDGFRLMLERFGPRGWWPGETPFEVMVGAILTQNTNWKNVEKAIANLKREGVLDPQELLDLSPARLASLIRPAGYFRVKAKRLRSFLKYFVENYEGNARKMAKRELPKLREELLAVNGIGPETADSILLYALKKPVFVIDAYTKRILSRHGLCAEEDTYDDLQALFMDRIEGDIPLYNEYHALIVETGKDYCRTNPRCEECPLNGWNGLP